MLVMPPKLATMGFEEVEILPPRAPAPNATAMSDYDRGYIAGAVGMAQLNTQRQRQERERADQRRREILARTKWGVLYALALLGLFAITRMPW